jgi:hypothetical protein
MCAGRSSPICAIADGLEADSLARRPTGTHFGKKSTVDLESQYLGLPGPTQEGWQPDAGIDRSLG